LWGTETRESIWIGFVDLAAAQADLHTLTIWSQNRFVAGPEFAFEALKIGGGPPPVRVPEGWLVLHHGVTGHLEPGVAQQQRVHYAAGGMIRCGRAVAALCSSSTGWPTPPSVPR
jgi:hypothetical protein